MPRPDIHTIPSFYHQYIAKVQEDDLMQAFNKYTALLFTFLENIPENKYDYRYTAGKWSLKEMVQHLLDAERIFNYRSLCFARQDKTPLPGFDENLYALNSKADSRNWKNLLDEYKAVRKSTEWLYASFDDEQLQAKGISNNAENYVLGFGFITIGHSLHHKQVIEERYL